jgi:methionyl-tRNA synthetase
MGPEKRIYVWFENVIGYLSASKEWAEQQGDPDAWRAFWQDTDCRSYYFIGKDNIFFHTMSWPAEILAYADGDGAPFIMPYDVPANHFNNVGGQKASTSRNRAVWIPDLIGRYDADPFRYYLCATMPESADSDFTWREFVARNNNELVATWGNLVNRALTLTYRNFQGKVPDPGALDHSSKELLSRAERMLQEVAEHLRACHFRAGLGTAMNLAHATNRYLDETAPWKSLPNDAPAAARSLYTVICSMNGLKVALWPYVPFSSDRLHSMLGYDSSVLDEGWRMIRPQVGQQLREPQPLFAKLDASIIDEEEARLGT